MSPIFAGLKRNWNRLTNLFRVNINFRENSLRRFRVAERVQTDGLTKVF
jgi:hypothetical protein